MMRDENDPEDGDVQSLFTTILSEDTDFPRYELRRQNLVSLEKTDAWDKAARSNACDVEILASDIVQQIRAREEDEHYGALATESIPHSDARESGGKFLLNLDRIESSRLFQVIKNMPKGANLHLHFNAALDAEPFLDMAKSVPTMFIRSTRPLLDPQDYELAELVFRVLPTDTDEADIFSKSYNPSFHGDEARPWMSWSSFRKAFTHHVQGDPDQFVMKKIMIGAEEIYDPSQTLNGIWARFNQSTRCAKGLVAYESAYRLYIQKLLRSFVEDKVMYAELRPMLLDKFIPTDDGRKQLGHFDQMRIILEEIDMAKLNGANSNPLPFGFKIIYCTPRSVSMEVMRNELKDCLNLKQAFPSLICGFDLVGAEDRPNSIHYYTSELLAFRKTCQLFGLDIPFLFHAGETLLDSGGTKSPRESNLYDAVLLNSKRIGHGFACLKHPLLAQMIRDNGTCIEVCPISNEVLHLCGNAKQHPLPEFLAQGLHCCICSDNQTFFRTTLSHDFYQVLVGDQNMNLHGLRQLAEWSLEHSCLSKSDQTRALEIFRTDWKAFCQWVVDEFADIAAT